MFVEVCLSRVWKYLNVCVCVCVIERDRERERRRERQSEAKANECGWWVNGVGCSVKSRPHLWQMS